MEKMIIYRDRQEVQAGDHNAVQAFTRAAIDRVVREGLTDEKKFTGFLVAKTGATTVQIAPGAYYVNGEIYARESAHDIDFIGALPLTTQKIAAVALASANIETDLQPRDFLVDVETGETEPDTVAMEARRQASFNVIYGNENAAPQRPTVGSDTIVVAWVTLTTTGVQSIERATENELMSAKRLAQRATDLEIWRAEAGERITTLGSDLTALASAIGGMASSSLFARLFADVASIKESLDLEDGYSGYAADHFLALDQSDSNPSEVGYSAKVEEGLRFADDNASATALTLFNPLDPSVKLAANGLLLPKYTEVRRVSVDKFYQQLSLSQYQFQTHSFKIRQMSASRLRFGLARTVCNNSEFWKTGKFDYKTGIFTALDGRTYQALDTSFDRSFTNSKAKFIRLQEFWYDVETEYYEERVTTDYAVSGALVAQTFLNTQHGWLTSIDLAFTQVGATGNVHVLVTKTKDGKPDPAAVVGETTINVASLVKGTDFAASDQWTRVPIIPIALAAGERYAIVLVTGGDHFVGLASGEQYAAGTLFYSTDGAFLQGDLTLDMLFRLNFAQFAASRLEVDLGSLNLSGGINDIDIAAEGVQPDGTQLFYEIRPEGSGVWQSLSGPGANPFAGLPALVHMRAVFIGTKDVMPAIRLVGSKVKVSRPRTSLLHFTDAIALPSATRSIKVMVILDHFREANHDFSVRINDLTNGVSNIAAGSVTDEILSTDGTYARIRRTFEWTAAQLATATSSIVIKSIGACTAATEIYHVEKRAYLSF